MYNSSMQCTKPCGYRRSRYALRQCRRSVTAQFEWEHPRYCVWVLKFSQRHPILKPMVWRNKSDSFIIKCDIIRVFIIFTSLCVKAVDSICWTDDLWTFVYCTAHHSRQNALCSLLIAMKVRRNLFTVEISGISVEYNFFSTSVFNFAHWSDLISR